MQLHLYFPGFRGSPKHRSSATLSYPLETGFYKPWQNIKIATFRSTVTLMMRTYDNDFEHNILVSSKDYSLLTASDKKNLSSCVVSSDGHVNVKIFP